MKIHIKELRSIIRSMIKESWGAGTLGPSVSAYVDPNEKEEQPSLDLAKDVERLQSGKTTGNIDNRGVPAPPPLIKQTVAGPWLQPPGTGESEEGAGEEESEE